MNEEDNIKCREEAALAIAKGHSDPGALREFLIWTTSIPTEPLVMAYLREHLSDPQLLHDLITIALEGEDCGDVPWAAANVIAEFPPALLLVHRGELEALSRKPWMYLSDPTKRALAKLPAV